MNPSPWVGACHAFEIPLVVGTYGLTKSEGSWFPCEAPTKDEKVVSEYMQGAWVAFAKDPVDGLLTYGWPKWTPGNGTDALAELGMGNKSGAVFAPSDIFVGMCGSLVYYVGP
jgi:carboxylesterase type B